VLRITWTDPQTSCGALVEGEIAGDYVEELARFARNARKRAGKVTLHLDNVTFVDHAGVRLLRDLREQGVELSGGSSFVCGLVNSPDASGVGGVE
jgi:ABC-type transporter Mla MlaB component